MRDCFYEFNYVSCMHKSKISIFNFVLLEKGHLYLQLVGFTVSNMPRDSLIVRFQDYIVGYLLSANSEQSLQRPE